MSYRSSTYGDSSHSSTISNCSIDKLEHVVVRVGFYASDWGNIAVYLTSPSGTKSRLMRHRFYNNIEGGYFWDYMSVNFWGEGSTGSWTITLVDASFTCKLNKHCHWMWDATSSTQCYNVLMKELHKVNIK